MNYFLTCYVGGHGSSARFGLTQDSDEPGRGTLTGHFLFSDDEPQEAPTIADSRARSFWIGIGAIVAGVSLLTIFAATVIDGDGGSDGPIAIAGVVTTPIESPDPTEEPAVAAATETAAPATATPPPIASSISATPIVGEAVSSTPIAVAPTSSNLTAAARALAQSIESQYGVRILDAGQDWGATGDLQLRNVGAAGEALASVPAGVRVATAASRPLTFLSNHTGMTEAGWEPYGAREANFYSNEDVSTSGRVAANQIVLQPGSNSQTIAHEIMHAYQMRDTAAGQYALALLTPEMKSFMGATGWTQTGTDDDVRAAASGGWTGINALFKYEGRPLTYNNEFGDAVTLFTPNPLEAYAEAGGLFYGHSSRTTLPEWPEYWDWFRSHTG